MNPANLIREQVLSFQDLLLAIATGVSVDPTAYVSQRAQLLATPRLKRRLPTVVVNNRSPIEFRQFIKGEFSTYQERRQYIWDEFRPLLAELEQLESGLVARLIRDHLGELDAEHVQAVWEHALENIQAQPEDAITAARTLLESVCRIILEDLQVSPADDWDLPRLYRATAEKLNLAPTQHTEQAFRQILGSCQQVVEGLGGLRNKLGDAHGQGKRPVKPAPRHAQLAVNLAGAMAVFLVQTWKYHKERTAIAPPAQQQE